MKVVLDTNVLLAAFATHGLCESVLQVCLESHVLILSRAILDELAEHLSGKFKMPAKLVRENVKLLAEHAGIVKPADVPSDACRDPNDLMVLGTAVAGAAECLVTGDEDLLILGEYQSIPILSPREFYEYSG